MMMKVMMMIATASLMITGRPALRRNLNALQEFGELGTDPHMRGTADFVLLRMVHDVTSRNK